jgi:hypothetical protein
MANKPDSYPALYLIFTLLHALRRGVERKNIWIEFRRQKIALKPRLSFWISVCKQAGLVSGEDKLIVTRQARAWLNKSPEEQAILLIAAWQNAPKNSGALRFRKKLFWKLKHDKFLTQKDLGALRGLEALGLYSNGRLTTWGRLFIKGDGDMPTPKPAEPCHIANDHFIAPLASHTDLLWEIENYLRPSSPGAYPLLWRTQSRRAANFPLAKKSLRGIQSDPQELIALMERGLRAPLPGEIKARLLDQPSLRLIEGVVLELSHPSELQALRRNPNLRRHIERVLSPRHILVSAYNAPALLKILTRRGVHIEMNEEKPEVPKKRTHFSRSPSRSLDTLPKYCEFGEGRGGTSKLELLDKYRQLQQAIDILYRTPGYPAEHRRITPLLIEQRGEFIYVSAFCQTRRAQLTFRLDRMEIPGLPAPVP